MAGHGSLALPDVSKERERENESLWGVACGVFRMLRKNYGCVRVDFTQPFSLKVSPPPDNTHSSIQTLDSYTKQCLVTLAV